MKKTKYYDSTIEAPSATMDQYYAGVSERVIVDEIEKIGRNLKILDIGCGEGLLGSFLISRNNEVHGVDIHEEKVKRCQEKGILAKLITPDGRLPYEKETFDVVTCCQVLEHLMDPFKLLAEIRNVLKDNGLLVVTVPNMYDLRTRVSFPFGARTKITFGANLGHIRFFSRASFKKLVEEEEFKICKNISYNFANYLPKLIGLVAYLAAFVANPKDIRNLKLNKQRFYQNINLFLTRMFGFTSFGCNLLIFAKK